MVIHFICRGNAFRSIIAEAYLKSLKIPGVSVLSSGTVANKYKKTNAVNFPKTLALLKRHGIAQYAKNHYADDTSQSLLDKSDLVVCLNKIVHEQLDRSFKLPEKMYVWNIIDLGEKGRIATTDAEQESYMEDVYEEVVENINNLLNLNNIQNT